MWRRIISVCVFVYIYHSQSHLYNSDGKSLKVIESISIIVLWNTRTVGSYRVDLLMLHTNCLLLLLIDSLAIRIAQINHYLTSKCSIELCVSECKCLWLYFDFSIMWKSIDQPTKNGTTVVWLWTKKTFLPLNRYPQFYPCLSGLQFSL